MVTKSEDKTAFNLVLEFSSSLPRPLSSPVCYFFRECFFTGWGRGGHARCSLHQDTWLTVQ